MSVSVSVSVSVCMCVCVCFVFHRGLYVVFEAGEGRGVIEGLETVRRYVEEGHQVGKTIFR